MDDTKRSARTSRTHTLYLSASFAFPGEMLHNRRIADALSLLGYTVILPQDRLDLHMKANGTHDAYGFARDCESWIVGADVVVALIPHARADIRIGIEIGMRLRTEDPLIGIVLHATQNAEHLAQDVGYFQLMDDLIPIDTRQSNDPMCIAGKIDIAVLAIIGEN